MSRKPMDVGQALKDANRLYDRLPVYLQQVVDEDDDSGLESEELPDGYNRLGIGDD